MLSRRTAVAGALIVVGVGLSLYSMYVATGPPRLRHARSALGVINSAGQVRPQTVAVPAGDGATFTSLLRDSARTYEEAGPIKVLVVGTGPTARVYDANGRPNGEWWWGVGVGLVIALSTVCGQRCARIGVHTAAVKV